MVTQNEPQKTNRPTPIGAAAEANLSYIRNTIEATQTFTTISGKGCLVMGAVALTAAALESLPSLSSLWLPIWCMAAVVAGATAMLLMESKARRQGVSLRRTVALRFFFALVPAFATGALLTFALRDLVGRDIVAAIWELTYGVGLAACGLFSIPAVVIAGLTFMGVGAIALVAPAAWAPALLALSFGGVHIALGILIMRNHGG